MPNFSPVPQPSPLPLQKLEGVIERFTFQNEENGYTVAHLTPRGKTDDVTIVGNLSGVHVGESLRLTGLWTTHSQYGRQFEVRTFQIELPATIVGIRKYLGSGLIKGVGPVTAERIVKHFGLETLDVIERAPDRLMEVDGIGYKRTDMITRAWEEQKQIKEIMVFLQGHGVSASLAVKIFKQYGNESIQVVQQTPYRLARDIWGIGFKTADKIALQLGIKPDAPQRIQAGILYALSTLSDDGHCFGTRQQILAESARLLEVSPELCLPQLETLLLQQELLADEDAIYLPPFYYAETGAATRLERLLHTPEDRLDVFQGTDWPRAFEWLNTRGSIQLTEQQKAGVRMALTERVSILTGGPGTGKSTITASIIALLQTRGRRVLLAAPTGRAAKRLKETTGLEAKTIHRLLEYSPAAGNAFQRNQEHPLDTDLLIIDETSMVDILLINHLLEAVPAGTHLLLVGDVDQLPSVGPGNVLRDLIASEVIPVTRLETIFRQADDSYIIVNAHRINQGEMPIFASDTRDFFLFSEADPQKAADWVLDIVSQRVPARFGFTPDQIQVLSPMHRGSAGVAELNQRLQEKLNPPAAGKIEFRHGSRIFRLHDRVMQIRNDYDKQVFNGDMGRIVQMDLEEQTLNVDFEDHVVSYDFTQMDEVVHSYAVSIHKSQGSEFPVVVIPILSQHYMMLQRNLLYTGVTRARQMVVLVGEKKAIFMAVRNNRITQRNTRLSARLALKK